MTASATMSASAFRKKWRINLLRVQSGEEIKITRHGKITAILKTDISVTEREVAATKLAQLLAQKLLQEANP